MKDNLDAIVYNLGELGYKANYIVNYPSVVIEIEVRKALMSFSLLENDVCTPERAYKTYKKILKGIS